MPVDDHRAPIRIPRSGRHEPPPLIIDDGSRADTGLESLQNLDDLGDNSADYLDDEVAHHPTHLSPRRGNVNVTQIHSNGHRTKAGRSKRREIEPPTDEEYVNEPDPGSDSQWEEAIPQNEKNRPPRSIFPPLDTPPDDPPPPTRIIPPQPQEQAPQPVSRQPQPDAYNAGELTRQEQYQSLMQSIQLYEADFRLAKIWANARANRLEAYLLPRDKQMELKTAISREQVLIITIDRRGNTNIKEPRPPRFWQRVIGWFYGR